MEYILLISVAANLVLAFLVLAKVRFLTTLHKAFITFLFITAIWAFFNFLLLTHPDSIQILRTTYALGSLVAVTAVIWILRFTDKIKSRTVDWFFWGLGIFFFLGGYIPNGIVHSLQLAGGSNVARGSLFVNNNYQFESGALFPFFIFFVAVTILIVFWALVSHFLTAKGIARERARYILFGATIFAGGELVSNVILPLMGFRPVTFWDGILPVFFTFPAAYAMIRYRFMDVRVALRKGTVYTVTLAIALGVYIYFTFLASRFAESTFDISYQVTSIVGVVLIALGFYPLRKLVEHFLDSYVFPKRVDLRAVSKKIQENLTEGMNTIENHLKILREELNTNMGVEYVDLFIKETESLSPVSPLDRSINIQKEEALLKYIMAKKIILVAEELDYKIQEETSSELQKTLEAIKVFCQAHNIAVIIPLTNPHDVIGILFLGPKRSKMIYSLGDIKFLEELQRDFSFILGGIILYQQATRRVQAQLK